ncbi:MAG TPA: DNA recombination protein RmuC [Candidatus Moranbacteria bacterium]|nr:DNA recombination protein RmuC [Candidatus Moranbacteria bacterium]HRZ33672.1 DNA recombination protein RmuC [Candidatus Moranbacteria bacterium]
MPTLIVAVLSVLLLAALLWLVFDLKKKIESKNSDREAAIIQEKLSMLLDENRRLRDKMDEKLSETHRATQEQINHTMQTVQGITGQSAKQIADMVSSVTKLEETNKQVVNFSAQLQNLQDILRNTKQRGILGEYFLETTLKNVLPPDNYKMQYKFKDGEIVDAVVFVGKSIVPIDSKFSLENYEKIVNAVNEVEREKYEKLFKQDLKNRIDETSKYIRPDEGTMEFAFMFIPSETIYYDLLMRSSQVNSADLIEYAFNQKHVIIVSPTNFLAYLQTVLQGLRAFQIEENAKEIRTNVEKLGKHIIAYEEYFKKVGNNLGTTVNSYNAAYKELGKIDKDVSKITEKEKKIEPLVLEKPHEII